MASDDTMTIHSSMHEDEDEYDHDHDHDQHPTHNLSRLSICSSKQSMNDFDDAGCTGGGDMMMMYMSGLSIQSYDEADADADEEFSNGDDDRKGMHMYGASSDSDKDMVASFLSLPTTPLQSKGGVGVDDLSSGNREYYCSENEVGGNGASRRKTKRNSRRRAVRERWLDREWERKQYKAKALEEESEGSTTMSRQKSLCMDLGEVKACRELGFELDLPSQVSFSTMDTASSGGNSPIGCWRISSPGDDPKDVKARLKVWAQAVAASASRLVG